MKGTLIENGTEKGTVPDFEIEPGQNIYADAMGEKVLVGRTNDTATFTSPIGSFHPLKSYEIRVDGKSYVIKVRKQTNSSCFAVIESPSSLDNE